MVPRCEEFTVPEGAGRDTEEQWTHLVSLTHGGMTVRLPRPADGRLFEGVIRRRWIGDLALVDCACDPCSGTRPLSRIAASEADHIAILFNTGGRETVSQGDLNIEMRAGDVVVWDTRSPIRFEVRERLTKRSLLVPRAALAEVGGRSWDTTGSALDGSSPAVRLLAGYLELLSSTLHAMTPEAVGAARNAALELFVGAVRPQQEVADSDASGPVLRSRMEEWINTNLFDVEPTPAAIAAAHGVSVRTVYRVFASNGDSLGQYVRSRRLARARLALTAQRHLPISTIARRFGFADSSHFTRAFKGQYGISPSEYRVKAHELVQRPGA